MKSAALTLAGILACCNVATPASADPTDVACAEVWRGSRGLRGEQLVEALAATVKDCFGGTWEGQVRHYIPGRPYPQDHVCCPAVRMELIAQKDSIGLRLEEVDADSHWNWTTTCLPDRTGLDCVGLEPGTQCRLEWSEPETPSGALELECRDERGHYLLVGTLEQVPLAELALRQRSRAIEAGIADRDDAAVMALLDGLLDAVVSRDADSAPGSINELRRINEYCDVLSVIVERLGCRDLTPLARKDLNSVLRHLTGIQPRHVSWWRDWLVHQRKSLTAHACAP